MGMGFLPGTDPKNEDPVGDVLDPVARFTATAVDVGLIRQLDKQTATWSTCAGGS